ncbi:MAG: prephenate dehydratase [Candidatus Omnitrophota bacterium]|nr:MAG: prephenate dehydratase [Candidatus Omnitrophota bacterium]
MRLTKNRRKIDRIDEKIIELLNKRARTTLQIKRKKLMLKEALYTPHREKEIYENVLKKNKGPLSKQSIKAIYREIMSGSLSLEKTIKVAYLGPPLTFTHLAALSKFGRSVAYTDCNGIGEVFNEVEKERADYGVVPIENSIEGAVNYTFDMFVNSDLKICSEIYLEVSHSLLGKVKDVGSIKKVYSHPQVFAQCRRWIEKRIPRAELIEVSSTSKAAELSSKRKNSACIASRMAAGKYGLKVLESGIEDTAHNVTRFLVIGEKPAEPTENNKTSIMFSIKDRVGALHDILVPFKKNRINLTKIESRPSRLKAWEYYFFVDLEGHYKDKKVEKALSELEKGCTYLKVLGSYPVGK